MNYQDVICKQRYYIEAYKKAEYTQNNIPMLLEVSSSTHKQRTKKKLYYTVKSIMSPKIILKNKQFLMLK